MSKPQVSIVMGSESDLDVMREGAKILSHFGVPHEVQVLSAHRSPERVAKFSKELRKRGVEVVIAGAGGAAHLAGAIAANTTIPVIGVPMNSALNGLDSLLSTVQMPSGVPVATVSIGKSGAMNAAILAVQILALRSKALQAKLSQHKVELSRSVTEKNKRLKRAPRNWLKGREIPRGVS
ncbi:MAG: 5-(carboxyamino)imidazole ribonucleotide mutase [Omnitrophica bacterium RIFCSPLOWO2_12_FULL_50_11]|nr:MAG: 5-(carboxyamino)imidazole ribonucleotide mutase [Omnitrophica bacterium RIFCSPLOWO2_12_FULL_50_11]